MYRIIKLNNKNIDFLDIDDNISILLQLHYNKFSIYTNTIKLSDYFELENVNTPQLPTYSKILRRKKHKITNIKKKLQKFIDTNALKTHIDDVLDNLKFDNLEYYKLLNTKDFFLIDLINEITEEIWLEIKISKIKYYIDEEFEMLSRTYSNLNSLVNNKINYLLKDSIPNDIIKKVFNMHIENIIFSKANEDMREFIELFNSTDLYFTNIKLLGKKEEVNSAIKKFEKYFVNDALEFVEDSNINTRFDLFFSYNEIKNFCFLPLESKHLNKEFDTGDKSALLLDDEKQYFRSNENNDNEKIEIDFDLKYIHNLQIKYNPTKKEDFKNMLQRILLYNIKKRIEEGNSIKVYDINFEDEEYLPKLNAFIEKNIFFTVDNHNTASNYLNNIVDLVKTRKIILENTKTKDIFQYNKNENRINLKESILILTINVNSISNNFDWNIVYKLSQYYKLGIFMILYNMKEIKLDSSLLYLDNDYVKLYNTKFSEIKVPSNETNLIDQIYEIIDNNQTKKEKDFIEIPIGVDKYRNTVYFRLGDNMQSYHAIVVGTTGTGKTSLIKNILVETAKKYTADDITFILMDYKPGGVEFNLFDQHPNVELINTSPNDFLKAKNIFEKIKMLVEERDKLFSKNKISHIEEYNRKFPNSKLAHTIVVIDEFQRLINENFSGRLSYYYRTFLSDFVRNYRAYGFHLLLSTQTLKNVDLSSDVLGLLATRISFKVLDYFDVEKIIDSKLPLHLNRYECLIYVKGAEETFIKVFTNPTLTYEEMNKLFNEIKEKRKKDEYINPYIV